jgi:hypothetical protein
MGHLKGIEAKPEDVFREAANLLDFLLASKEISQEDVDGLWSLLINDIREWKPDTKDEDKMLVAGTVFWIIKKILCHHAEGHFCNSIHDMLEETLERELKIFDQREHQQFLDCLSECSVILSEWINKYDDECDWLSDQITDTLESMSGTKVKKIEANKKKGKGDKTNNIKSNFGKPKTLKYYTHGNKGVLKKQGDRLRLVLDKWNKWGWIDSETTTDDLDAFFEGDPRHCNIAWRASTTVLTFLLQELLKQPYITKQKRQSASSMVKEQFGLTPNFDQNRLADDDEFRIEVTVYLLNINNPLPLLKGGGDKDYDITDATFQAVLSGQLRKTKGI